MNRKITIDEWRTGHMLPIRSASDAYYVKMANKIVDYIQFVNPDSRLGHFEYIEMAKLITYYFEDVISGLGFWEAFVKTHKELYGKSVPFYDIDEDSYLTDEINYADVQLLVWMGVQRFIKTSFINPENPTLAQLSATIYALLDKEFENAPINTQFVTELYHKRWFDNFFNLKEWCCRLYISDYLMTDESRFEREIALAEELSSVLGQVDEHTLTYATTSSLCFSDKIGPLALKVTEWGIRMLKNRGMEAESQALSNFQFLPYAAYLLKKSDEKTLTVESVEGECYVINRSSFNNMNDDMLKCKTLVASIVLYNNTQWQVNGVTSLIKDKETFSLIRNTKRKQDKEFKNLYGRLMKKNSNRPIAYFSDYNDMKQWMNKHVGLDSIDIHPEDLDEDARFALFFESTGIITILQSSVSSIKDEYNPYYDPAEAREEAFELLVLPGMTSKELIHYLLDNKMLPDARAKSLYGAERGRRLIQDNMDFIVRYFHRVKY